MSSDRQQTSDDWDAMTKTRQALAQQAQEVERLTKETAKYKALLLQSCTDNTEEYGVECKPKCNSHGHEDDCPVSHPGLVFQQLRKDLAAMTAERDEAIVGLNRTIDMQASELAEAQVAIARLEHEKNDAVYRNKILRERPDLPIERIRAYDAIMGKVTAAEQQVARLREALEKLCNEVSALLGLQEEELRDLVGHSNVGCLKERLSEGKHALRETGA